MPHISAVTKRRLKLAGRAAILAVVAWFVHGAAQNGWQQLQQRIDAGQWSPARLQWPWLLAAAVVYSLGQLPCGLFWQRILAGLGQHVPPGSVLRAFYIGHLGKYVPGKAMVVVMRTSMLVQAGAKAGPAAVSVFYETLTMMAVGAAVSTAVIALRYSEHTDWLLASVAMIGVTGLPTFPPVFEQIMRRMRIGRSDEAAASHEVRRLGFATFLSGWALMTVAWIMLGISVWATVRAGGFSSDRGFAEELTIGTAAAALAVVIGFLSFIPGGFGVRDGVMFTVLTWTYDDAIAMVTAILVRLIWLVAELLVSVILYKSAAGPRVGELVRRQSRGGSAPGDSGG